ncbi:probable LRR receptor-like serine/threonine-protein kinase At4g37250 [Aristolochia californica]|uniref:probable LRR receptor-like serine/threonine-protein kinase At4g37250 n=1 Tax=Aristolochia californica TaxID=171875 RepID=UPI0035E1AFA6
MTPSTRYPGPGLGLLSCSFVIPLVVLVLLAHPGRLLALNFDGVFLLSFKYAVLSDPLGVLDSWNYADESPCGWKGVACTAIPEELYASRVVAVVLPQSQILGSLPQDLGLVQHLRHLDLSGNFLNGTLPSQLFNVSQLKILALANNEISGELPELVGGPKALECLNLSDNAFTGKIPWSLNSLPNLTVLSLSNNYFSGDVPTGLQKLQVLDLSSNLLNETLGFNFTAEGLKYLNLSSNRFSGEISPEFASGIPANATVDFSSNNFTGEIPRALMDQKAEAFIGNPNLCGKPLKNPCVIPSTRSNQPNVTNSPPAIAAIPRTLGNGGPTDGTVVPAAAGTPAPQSRRGGMKPGVIAGIVFGDLVGIGILAMVFLYVYQARKKKRVETVAAVQKEVNKGIPVTQEWSSPESGGLGWSCLRKKGGTDEEETSETTGSESESEQNLQPKEQKKGSLVTVDGETELEMETLLKASAYILGATGSSIIYKAVLEDGTTLAVRRIGETGVERFRDFENQVRLYAKLRHPNLVRIRGFYWGDDEKLIIYDYLSNGSLASHAYKKMGSSPLNLSWDFRLRIAKGVARGLAYLHDKKYVHGNLKPSNVLLGQDMEPRIGDFGLERLLSGESSNKTNSSARHFGSKRSTLSRDSLQETVAPIGASPSTSTGGLSPYHAPESLKYLKPNPKWDVYSFGIVLLEVLSGKVFSDKELSQWNTGFIAEDKIRVLRMADVALRSEVEGKEEALMACFKLGFSCASAVPQRRPSMKEALQVLDKIPISSPLV